MIFCELCNKLKFDHMIKWYMNNLESVLENKTHKLLWYFEIQMDHLILACGPYNNQQKREKLAEL